MIKSGEEQCDIALYYLDSVAAALEKMTKNILGKYGNLPLVFAGGVMSNSIIRQRFTKEFGAYFAEPAFSADNAAGTAYLTYLREQKMLETVSVTVSQLNRYIKSVMDSDYNLRTVFVSGEISNFTNHYRTGHFLYDPQGRRRQCARSCSSMTTSASASCPKTV